MLEPCPIAAMLQCNIARMEHPSFPVQLDSGESVQLRPIGPRDTGRMKAGIAALSDHSRYLRFFNGSQTLPDHVIERLCDADGWKHIAWGAIDHAAPGQPAIGAVHAIRRGASNEAELALAVLDAWHGKGLARLLLTAVLTDARAAGITRLAAETMAENRASRQLFRSLSGLSAHREGPVVSYRFDTDTALKNLEPLTQGPAGTALRAGLKEAAARRARLLAAAARRAV